MKMWNQTNLSPTSTLCNEQKQLFGMEMHTFQHQGQRFIIKYSLFRFDLQASAARQDSSQVQAVESKQV